MGVWCRGIAYLLALTSPNLYPGLIENQIFPTNFRARGLNLAASGGSIGSIIASQVWPVGMDRIGSKTYFIFMCVNLVSIIVRNDKNTLIKLEPTIY